MPVLAGDTVRDLFYALRTFKRAPLVACTIVLTVALGLGLVAVAFTVLNALLFRVDAVPDVHEMFAVQRTTTSDGKREPFTRVQFAALRRETSVFTDAYAELSQVDGRVDGRMTFGTFVTGNCFQVLGVSAAIGRTLVPADDEPFAGQPVMVLSHRGWDRLFGRDPAIVGRHLRVNETTFEIVGVMPEQFRGLTVTPDDYWAPLSTVGGVRPLYRRREATVGVDIIGRLKPGMSRQAVDPPCRLRAAHRRRLGRGSGRPAAGHAGCGRDWRDHSRSRSGCLRPEPGDHCRRLPCGRRDPGRSRRPPRSSADASPGLKGASQTLSERSPSGLPRGRTAGLKACAT